MWPPPAGRASPATGPATPTSLGHLLGARHSHLDNAGYGIDQKLEPYTDEAIVDRIIADEAERIVQTSMAICLFARGVYDLETISQALASVGIERSADELRAMGQRVYWERVRLRERLGFQARARGSAPPLLRDANAARPARPGAGGPHPGALPGPAGGGGLVETHSRRSTSSSGPA